MRNQDKYNTINVRAILKKDGFFLMDEYIDAKTKMLCKDINKIPKWVDYSYSNKLNIKEIQEMLNNYTVVEIANELSINPYRIYDAIYSKKIFYPSNYKYKNIIKQEYIS